MRSWQVRSGVKFGEGDGTVPLLSLGAMCARGWKEERYNPGGVKIITQGAFCLQRYTFSGPDLTPTPADRIQA